jgi:hypothetical protein
LINYLTSDNYTPRRVNMVNPFISDAIMTVTTTLVLFGFCDSINKIRHMHIVGNCTIPIPGTNYVVKFTKYIRPSLCYTITDTDVKISYHEIGTITWPRTIIPNPKKIVVVQPCPGLYNTYDWHGVRVDLKGVITKDTKPTEFVECVVRILKSIGYVSLQNGSPEKDVSMYDIMDQLKALFDQTDVEHATNHMKQIFNLMHQLECIVISSVI